MSKFWLLLLLAVVVYLFWKSFRSNKGSAARRQPDPPKTETMVPCAQCGLNVPRGEATTDGARFFCSSEHMRRFTG
jgi:uncharacterized protein